MNVCLKINLPEVAKKKMNFDSFSKEMTVMPNEYRLPFSDHPLVTCYHSIAFPLGIIEANARELKKISRHGSYQST